MKSVKWLSIFAFVVLAVLIVFFTFRGSSNVSDLSWMPQRWGLWLDEHDEFRHFIGFAVFAAVGFSLNFDSFFNRSHSRFIRKFRSSRYRTGRLGLFMVLVYALELAQINMPNRDFDWLDILNGWGGVLLGWIACVGWKFHRRHQRRRSHETRHDPINVSSIRFR